MDMIHECAYEANDFVTTHERGNETRPRTDGAAGLASDGAGLGAIIGAAGHRVRVCHNAEPPGRHIGVARYLTPFQTRPLRVQGRRSLGRPPKDYHHREHVSTKPMQWRGYRMPAIVASPAYTSVGILDRGRV